MTSRTATMTNASFVAPPLRWRRSLFFRVVRLCAVLLICLLASVIVITHHFFQEIMRQMETQAMEIAHSLEIQIEEGFDGDYEALGSKLMDLYHGVDIKLDEQTGDLGAATFTLQRLDDGSIVRMARVPIVNNDQPMVMTVIMNIAPKTEILRAFRNRNLVILIIVFLVTLGFMVYFIGKALRPLAVLSESCAAVTEGHLRPVNTQGAVGEVLLLENTFNRMITSLHEKELMEAKLRQAQRLSALGNLAAGIAHDVRNPLNAIKLLSSHAAALLENDNHPAEKSLKTVSREVDRLEEIVSSFLSLARETEMHREFVEIDGLVAECVRLFQKEAESRSVRLTHDLRCSGLNLYLDAKQCTRAVLNVLMNAIDACPPDGRVRVFTRRTTTHCEIEIRDDGPGIPKEVMDTVFDPYFTTKPGGTGLGLSITRSIVEEHGGTIQLSASSDRGCQVLIVFPLDKAAGVVQ